MYVDINTHERHKQKFCETIWGDISSKLNNSFIWIIKINLILLAILKFLNII